MRGMRLVVRRNVVHSRRRIVAAFVYPYQRDSNIVFKCLAERTKRYFSPIRADGDGKTTTSHLDESEQNR